MNIWNEFYSKVFPYILAALVVGIVIVQSNSRAKSADRLNERFADAIDKQTIALKSMGELLGKQGYILSPTGAVQ
jgi:large-conductance mechanosensitive channel